MQQTYKQVLYKDVKGKQRVWEISVLNASEKSADIVTKYGLVGGKIQTRIKHITETKGGKSIFEYACSLAESSWIDKARLAGEDTSNVKNENSQKRDCNTMMKAMLAHDLKNRKITPSDYILQPKLDGRRALVYKDSEGVHICSRNGLECVGPLDHIKEDLECVLVEGVDVLDGEIYSTAIPRAKIVGLCNTKERSNDIFDKSLSLKFHVFDYFSTKDKSISFIDRHTIMKSKLDEIESKNIVIVINTEADTMEDIYRMHDVYVSQGYEGIIIRKKESKYVHNRTTNLLKHKSFFESEFEICGFHTGVDTRDGKQYVVWELWFDKDKSIAFSASMRGGLDERKSLLTDVDNYIGKLATVRYQSIMESGVPEFGVVVELDRDDI